MPKTLLVHGWWLISGEKMSKSAGNVVNPLELAEKFGADAFRYYLMREMTIGQDCDLSTGRFVARYTYDLANDLGNLVSRLLNMGHRYCGGMVREIVTLGDPEYRLRKLWETAIPKIVSLSSEFAFHQALEELFSCIKAVNAYAEERSPWKLVNSDALTDRDLVNTTIATIAETVRLAAILLAPVMPTIAREILDALGYEGEVNWTSAIEFGSSLWGSKIKERLILFPKIEEK
jgi:methionyl-tRNA synthetase